MSQLTPNVCTDPETCQNHACKDKSISELRELLRLSYGVFIEVWYILGQAVGRLRYLANLVVPTFRRRLRRFEIRLYDFL